MAIDAKDLQKAVIFSVNDKEYAIDVNLVLSIERLLPITRVPNVPEYIKGVVNLRGKIVPIMDLRLRLGLEEAKYTDQTRVIIIKQDENEVGLIVDQALEVLDFSEEELEQQPELSGAEKIEFIKGILRKEKRFFILLDVDVILLEKGMNSDGSDSIN